MDIAVFWSVFWGIIFAYLALEIVGMVIAAYVIGYLKRLNKPGQ